MMKLYSCNEEELIAFELHKFIKDKILALRKGDNVKFDITRLG